MRKQRSEKINNAESDILAISAIVLRTGLCVLSKVCNVVQCNAMYIMKGQLCISRYSEVARNDHGKFPPLYTETCINYAQLSWNKVPADESLAADISLCHVAGFRLSVRTRPTTEFREYALSQRTQQARRGSE